MKSAVNRDRLTLIFVECTVWGATYMLFVIGLPYIFSFMAYWITLALGVAMFMALVVAQTVSFASLLSEVENEVREGAMENA